MKKASFARLLVALTALCGVALQGSAQGWPSQYEGVMLQGFSWDSYKTDTKWTKLEAQAEELANYFDLIWIPNPGRCASGTYSNGYDPVYWFTNFSSAFGKEAELRSMIKTFKDRGLGTIVDVVLNHRSGKSNWVDFPSETWNGTTWSIPTSGICSDDEVWNEAAYSDRTKYPRGNADTGEAFIGSRDLDHTNSTVQNNCKNYCKFVLSDLGAVGYRLDMVKGYAAKYTQMYNQYANPTFSVGEYWDGNYDALAAWIEGTGKRSAAFDFSCKYQMSKAFDGGNYRELCWTNPSGQGQPAGLIHYGYQRYAVTFVDNHDTYRPVTGENNGNLVNNVEAANAFILCSPGTPCVYWPHWTKFKSAIKKMIAIRKAVGVTNESSVQVLQSDNSVYMAEVTGKRGKLVVKVGPSQVSPSGYSNSDIKASGTNYCIWTKVSVPSIPDPTPDPEPTPDPGTITVYYDNSASNWSTVNVWAWNDAANCVSGDWPGPAMTKVADNIYSFSAFTGTPTGIIFSCNDDKAGGGDLPFNNGYIYSYDGSSKPYSTGGGGGGGSVDGVYLIGNVNGAAWNPSVGLKPDKASGKAYTWNSVTIDDAGEGAGYFSFCTVLGTAADDWDGVNSGDRYGAASPDAPLALNDTAPMVAYPVNVSAMGCLSWMVTPGQYGIVADFGQMSVSLSTPFNSLTTVEGADALAPVEWFTLQGVRIDRPASGGIYIRRQGSKAAKVML